MRTRTSASNPALLPLALGALLTGCHEPQPTEPALEQLAAASQASASAASAAVRVHGGGQALVTDENGEVYSASVAISGVRSPNGSAHGSITIIFDPEFSAVWGAEPAHKIHVQAKVAAITADNGTVTLAGTGATETEIVRGGKKILFENEPFQLVITGPGRFSFTWCELPTFDFELTSGSLSY